VQLRLHVDSEPVYAALPFTLSVEALGFDESPEPKIAPLAIPGCRVTPLGATPNVSTMMTIVNGRRSQSRSVSYVFRFRVEAGQPGSYAVPPIVVEQGPRRAQTAAAKLQAVAVPPSQDMALRLRLPERPVWVGESFDVGVDWYLRRQPHQQTFVVPLFDLPEWLEVAAPRADPASGRERRIGFLAGAKTIELPFAQENATLDGAAYTRYRFTAQATALKAGTLDLAPARVMAQLEVGQGRDLFGFAAPRTGLFKAEDVARKLEIRAPPAEGRPQGFGGAVGRAFSIEAQADRTVVRVGDPIELRVTVRGDRVEGLVLPTGAALGLSPDLFSLPDEVPPGELLRDDTKDAAGRRGGKLFRVSVRLKSASVREIPPLALSYFDPESGRYATVRSQPIALSVRGAAVVGAQEVVDFAPARQNAPGPGGATSTALRRPQAAIGADLALGEAAASLRPALSSRQVLPLELALYGLSLLALAAGIVRLRTGAGRERASLLGRALAAVEQELAGAASRPAHAAAPQLLAAWRLLSRSAATEAGQGASLSALAERIELASFDPRTREAPLDRAILEEARALARRVAAERRPRPSGSRTAGSGAALLLLWTGAQAVRADGLPAQLEEARGTYQQALATPELDRRSELFARAEAQLAALAALHPDCPELLTDWGNAALGARDFGAATLAYRRALRLSNGAERARRNLAWVRSALPEWLPRPAAVSAADSLLFWRRTVGAPWRHLLAALAFACAALLAAPFAASPARRGNLRRAAVLPGLVWLALAGSLAADDSGNRDAVVLVEGAPLRAADSAGAPLATPQPLPAGAEVTVLSERPGWARVSLGGRTEGWVERASLGLVEAP
jgi:hypothetical protein